MKRSLASTRMIARGTKPSINDIPFDVRFASLIGPPANATEGPSLTLNGLDRRHLTPSGDDPEPPFPDRRLMPYRTLATIGATNLLDLWYNPNRAHTLGNSYDGPSSGHRSQ
jgi:hypothetical protein